MTATDYTLNEYRLALRNTVETLMGYVAETLPGVTVEDFLDGALDGARQTLEAEAEEAIAGTDNCVELDIPGQPIRRFPAAAVS